MSNFNSNVAVVKQVQTAINVAGRLPQLVVDGRYGANTILGVKWYQGLHGLTQDGVIGDLTVAATIAPPPGAASSLEAIQAQLAQLSGGIVPAPSAPLVPFPVTALSLPGSVPTPAPRPLVGEPMLTPSVTSSPAIKSVSAPSQNAALILAGLGLTAGAFVGALITFPLGALLGGALGGVAGFGVSTLQPGAKPAVTNASAATIHGEGGADFCDDLDGDFDEPVVVAGEIGTPTYANTLKG